MSDEVAEWLRRWTANPMCSARVGSNPILVVSITCIDHCVRKTFCRNAKGKFIYCNKGGEDEDIEGELRNFLDT